MTMNLDSPAFNARAYFKNFIKDKSVDEVLKRNNELFTGKLNLCLTDCQCRDTNTG